MRFAREGGRGREAPDVHPGLRRGFMMVDVMIALAVVVTLSGLLATSAVWSRRAADHLADTRAATATAEAALVELAQGHPAPAGVKVELAALESAIPGHRWVRVTAAVRGRSVTLVGLAKGAR